MIDDSAFAAHDRPTGVVIAVSAALTFSNWFLAEFNRLLDLCVDEHRRDGRKQEPADWAIEDDQRFL